MDEKQMIDWAVEEGFSAASVIDTSEIIFDPSFRPYCAENLCGQYGVNYACPPDCGTPEQMKERILRHKRALVLQTIWEIADYSDAPATKKAKGQHNAASIRLMKRFRAAGRDGFIVGSGGCRLCTPCAITQGLPCRFPDLQYSCASAYCIFVRKLAESAGMEYDCGPGLLAFFGMYVFD